jgi:heme A synthase
VASFFLVGLAIFSDGQAWEWHRALGGGIGFVVLLLNGVVFARSGLKAYRFPAVMLFTLYCLQFVWLQLGEALAIGWVQALHPANAMALAALSVLMARRAVG